MNHSYATIASPSEGEYKEKGSKFLGFALPVSDEDEVKMSLNQFKKKYYDARHVCFAYQLGSNQERYRVYDDGEPGHSAGDPILGQLRSLNLTNTLVIVVRYFGGTKLGVGGLINAYRSAAEDALKKAEIVYKTPSKVLSHCFQYEEMNRVMGVVKQFDLKIITQRYEEACVIELEVALHLEEQVVAKLKSKYK